jgi:hypothetical protein
MIRKRASHKIAKDPSVVAYDGFFYKAVRKSEPSPKRHWSWPESNDNWGLESLIPGEAENENTEGLFEFMHEIIDINYNNAVYSTFNTSRLGRIAFFWNEVQGMPFTNSDLHWIAGLAWKKWAKSETQKIDDFKNGLIRRWRENNG